MVIYIYTDLQTINILAVQQFYCHKRSITKRSAFIKIKKIIMSDQNSNQYNQNQHQKTTTDANDTHESASKTDKAEGVGENEENHTSGDHIQYQKEGKSSQNEKGGEDDKNVHSDNQGGTSSE